MVVALLAGRALVRFSPRALLGVGSALLAVGSVASAAAPTFALLALAQVPMWAGIATLLAAGVAGAAAWSLPERRTRVVAHALAGPPAAWIVGMPLIGVVARGALAPRLPRAAAAGGAARRPRSRRQAARHPARRTRTSLSGLLGLSLGRRWALGELLANAAWAGTLVYSGALLTEEYGLSTTATASRSAASRSPTCLANQRAGRTLQESARAAYARVQRRRGDRGRVDLGLHPGVAVTLAFFSLSAMMTATRTVAGTVYGFTVAGDLGREVGVARAVTTQIGYLAGSLLGGAAIALQASPGVGFVVGGLFLASTLPYVSIVLSRRPVVVAPEAAC